MKDKKRVKIAILKEFFTNLFDPKISFYAASMSWSTLFFIIPLLVIIFSIILNLPIFHNYYDKIHAIVASYIVPTNSKEIMHWLDTFISNAEKMGYIGIAYISIAAFLFFRDYDFIVNDIFDRPRRKLLNAIFIYITLILLIPTILTITIWFITINSDYTLIKLTSQFLIVWIIIFTIFKLTPKEKIPIKTVALSSFITSLVWTIAKTLFVLYITYNKTYTTIYGTISIVLFIFLWIYLSWIIFLHGLQLCNILTQEDE